MTHHFHPLTTPPNSESKSTTVTCNRWESNHHHQWTVIIKWKQIPVSITYRWNCWWNQEPFRILDLPERLDRRILSSGRGSRASRRANGLPIYPAPHPTPSSLHEWKRDLVIFPTHTIIKYDLIIFSTFNCLTVANKKLSTAYGLVHTVAVSFVYVFKNIIIRKKNVIRVKVLALFLHDWLQDISQLAHVEEKKKRSDHLTRAWLPTRYSTVQ